MIKIEFKEAQPIVSGSGEAVANFLVVDLKSLPRSIQAKSLTFGCPSELVPSRSEVLARLGISEQEDKLFQEQYKNV